MNTRSETVLFDLDGTLVDTAPDIVMAANHMLDEFGTAALPFETVSGFIGKGVPNLVRRTLEAAGLNQGTLQETENKARLARVSGRTCLPG